LKPSQSKPVLDIHMQPLQWDWWNDFDEEPCPKD